MTKKLLVCLISLIMLFSMGISVYAAGEKGELLKNGNFERINHKYAEDTDVDEYAKMCNMSKYHFMRTFKEQIWISPYAYKIKVRIGRAKDLLRHTDMSIAEIGNLLGYADASCFSKQFKKMIGISLLDYKKNKRMNEEKE